MILPPNMIKFDSYKSQGITTCKIHAITCLVMTAIK